MLHRGFLRQFTDSNEVVEAIFDDDLELSDKEDTESNDVNYVYSYLGHSIIIVLKL